jgi:hypothetical protein
MYYLMDEWAVYALLPGTGSASGFQATQASDPDFAQAVISCIPPTTMEHPDDWMVVIGYVPHPVHRRLLMDLPVVTLPEVIPIPYSPGFPAKAALRIELDEGGRPVRVDVLYTAPSDLSPAWWAEGILRYLRVQVRGEGHRLVMYLIVSVQASGLQVVARRDIVPACCCGDHCCI